MCLFLLHKPTLAKPKLCYLAILAMRTTMAMRTVLLLEQRLRLVPSHATGRMSGRASTCFMGLQNHDQARVLPRIRPDSS